MRSTLLTVKYDSVIILIAVFLFSCSVEKGLKKTAEKYLLNDAALQDAHTGIGLYDPQKKPGCITTREINILFRQAIPRS